MSKPKTDRFTEHGQKIRSANSPIAPGTRKAGNPGNPPHWREGVIESMSRIASENPATWPSGSLADKSTTRYDSETGEAIGRYVWTPENDARVREGHGRFAGIETGRTRSDRPNLQNIPLRTELGRKVREAFSRGEAP